MVRFRRFIAALLVVIMTAFAGMGLGFAQEQGGSGVQISPTRTEMSVQPGEQKDFDISVKNVTQGPITVKSYFNDFESDNVTGEPKIIVDPNRQLPNSMKGFVKGLSDFDLAKDETKQVKLTVDVPADATPGGYYGVVRFAAVPKGENTDEANTQVSLTASVASLLFVEVSGNITEQIQIDSVKVFKDDKGGTIFFSPPNKSEIAITNKGNSFAKPFGRITVSRGNSEVYAYELNNKEPRGTVLPNSSRTFSDEIKNVDKFGRYTVQASVSHGQGGEVIIQSTSFWFIPIWMVVLAAVLLISLIAGAVVTYRRMGKKRRK